MKIKTKMKEKGLLQFKGFLHSKGQCKKLKKKKKPTKWEKNPCKQSDQQGINT